MVSALGINGSNRSAFSWATRVSILRSGELEANINRLAAEYGLASVLELVSYEREHSEKSALSAWLVARRVRGPD